VLDYERGDGDIDWQRVEGRLVARRVRGAWTLAARGDVGAVFGDSIPAQQLFELGEQEGLPGYEYKAFAGDRAALVRTMAMWTSPYLRAPIRVPLIPVLRLWRLPGLQPGVSAGIQAGWTELSSAGARDAVRRFGVASAPPGIVPAIVPVRETPLSRPTDGIRATLDLRLRFFGGSVSVGAARPIDSAGRWRFVGGFGAIL